MRDYKIQNVPSSFSQLPIFYQNIRRIAPDILQDVAVPAIFVGSCKFKLL